MAGRLAVPASGSVVLRTAAGGSYAASLDERRELVRRLCPPSPDVPDSGGSRQDAPVPFASDDSGLRTVSAGGSQGRSPGLCLQPVDNAPRPSEDCTPADSESRW